MDPPLPLQQPPLPLQTSGNEEEENTDILNLFDPPGVRKKELWQCIKYIAPDATRKKWKKADAIGVYCTLCKMKVNYDSEKNPLGIQRHMNRFHAKLLEQYSNTENEGNKKRNNNTGSVEAYFPKKPRAHERRLANAVNQKEFFRLSARWTSMSLRPFSVVEDAMLQEMIYFANSCSGALTLPTRNTNRTYIMEEYVNLKAKVESDIKNNCFYFCTTSDMWSSRTMKAFMALTLHYLTPTFRLRNFTLEVKHVFGKHTGDMIRNEMDDSFRRWNLSKSCLTMMLRDSGSNMVKACEDWGVPHFPCIGHSLHLVVGPFLLIPKKKKEANHVEKDDDAEKDDENNVSELLDDEDEDQYEDSFDSEEAMVLEVRNIVQDLRRFCGFVKNSTKCIEKLESLQQQLGSDDKLKVKLDVRTRWNSTLEMLTRTIQLMGPINDFLAFYNSAAGKREYKGTKMKLKTMTDEKWAIVQGVCYLLAPFGKATIALSGEKYSTYVSALPVLRKVKGFISDPYLFNFNEEHLTKTKSKFFDLYGTLPFFDKVVAMLESCRVLLVRQFTERFSGLNISILWTSLLDPRFGLNSGHWNDDEEKEMAKTILLRDAEVLATPFLETSLSEPSVLMIDVTGNASEEDDDFNFDFTRKKITSDSISGDAQYELRKAKLKVSLVQEMKAYLLEDDCKDNPLEWWRLHCFRFPNIARVARKWLSVTATSTPSERVFSICGLVDSCKRSQMLGESIEAQVFVHNNYNECQNAINDN